LANGALIVLQPSRNIAALDSCVFGEAFCWSR
jgi:hypothetical protein